MKPAIIASAKGFALIYVALALLICLAPPVQGAGQDKRGIKESLILPKEMERPEPPRSDKAFFSPLPEKSVLLEIFLHEDGAFHAFEKRTLGDMMNNTSHARRMVWEKNIRSLFKFAADTNKRKKSSNRKGALEVADVDVVVYASPKVPLVHLQRLMIYACEQHIAIYRFHLVVKDQKKKEQGLLPFYLPCEFVPYNDPEEKAFLAHSYCVTFRNHVKGMEYVLVEPGGIDEGHEIHSLDQVETILDKIKTKDPKASYRAAISGIAFLREDGFPEEVTDGKYPATMQDLVDFLTRMASKGADLKNIKGYVYRDWADPEVKKLDD